MKKFLFPALTVLVLLVAWCRPGHAADIDGFCATTSGPCMAWDVTLPQAWEDHPTVVLRRVWDAERPNEGVLTVNGQCPTDLFGGLGVPANDNRELPRLSYEVACAAWRPGSNRVAIRWTTNQSPTVHEVRGGLAVAVREPPTFPPAGCRRARVQPTEADWRTYWVHGCTDGAGHHVVRVAVGDRALVEALVAEARGALLNEPQAPQAAGEEPPGLPWEISTAPRWACLLWGPAAGGCD